MAEASEDGGRRGGGLFQSLKSLGAVAVATVQTRLRLLSNEIQEEKLRFGRMLLLAAAALFFLALGAVLLSLLIVAAFWDSDYRLWVIAGLGLLYCAAGAILLLGVKREAVAGSRLFEASLAELEKDYEHLTS